jgi:hypothetical protein
MNTKKADELYRLAQEEHRRAYAMAKLLPGKPLDLDSPRHKAMVEADRVYNTQLEYQRKVRHGEVVLPPGTSRG